MGKTGKKPVCKPSGEEGSDSDADRGSPGPGELDEKQVSAERHARKAAKEKQQEKAAKEKVDAANVSIGSNTALLVLKLVVGFMMGSVAVVAEGIHSGIDLLAAIIAAIAVRSSARPADKDHHYGHGKFESVSGVVEAALIFVAAVIIIYEAGNRLLGAGEVGHLGWGVAVMGISVVVNIVVSRYLHAVAKKTDSVALEADSLHLSTDVITSVGVMVGLALIYITDYHWLDPLVAIMVAAIIIKAAYDLTKVAAAELVDASLGDEEMACIKRIVGEHEGMYVDAHKVRARKAGGMRYVDLHIVVHRDMHVHDAHEVAHHISEDIEKCIGGELGKSEVLVHIEPCDGDCEECEKDCGIKPDMH